MDTTHRLLSLSACFALLGAACDSEAPEPVDETAETERLLPGGFPGGPPGLPFRACDVTYSPPAAFPPIDPVGLLAGDPSDCSVATGNSPCAPHLVYSPSPTRERDPLFLFLPGTNMEPDTQANILLTAASTGYRTIGLSYDNQIKALDACASDNACGNNCRGEMREEVIRGIDVADAPIDVASGDAIVVRLYRLLEHLDTIDPSGGWADYYVPTTGSPRPRDILWENIIVGGFSQGAGHAAMISRHKQVHGLFVIDGASGTCDGPSGPEPAEWMTDGVDASAGRPKYAVRHDHGTGDTTTSASWDALGLGTSLSSVDCIAGGCDVIDMIPPPRASVTEQTPPPDPPPADRPFPSFTCTEHRSLGHDLCLPTDVDGTSAATVPADFRLFEVYARRMCYACDAATCP